jgi:hypothetical protein
VITAVVFVVVVVVVVVVPAVRIQGFDGET